VTTSGSVRERRTAPRRAVGAAEAIARVRLRGGRELILVDVSDAGGLVEGQARLLPGTHVDAHILTAGGRVLVRSRVSRAQVCRLAASEVTYRCALAFQQPVNTAGYGFPDPDSPKSAAEGMPYPPSAVQDGHESANAAPAWEFRGTPELASILVSPHSGGLDAADAE
jgi:hypothetical protein